MFTAHLGVLICKMPTHFFCPFFSRLSLFCITIKNHNDCYLKSLKDTVFPMFVFPDITLCSHFSLHMAQLANCCLFNCVYSFSERPENPPTGTACLGENGFCSSGLWRILLHSNCHEQTISLWRKKKINLLCYKNILFLVYPGIYLQENIKKQFISLNSQNKL